ncbi:MAG: aminotransferase class V-fold PLP-dependent enzyme [Bryobacteraceae bacterium]
MSSLAERYPAYRETEAVDRVRAESYGRLDRLGQVYLDYTGGSLYADSQVSAHLDLLRGHVFGNPHSANPSSAAMTALVESARQAVVRYFKADAYVPIFTQNASGALKLVAESFPFESGCRYLAAADNHNSVNGIREFARARGASVGYAPLRAPELRLDREALAGLLAQADASRDNLFAFPAQSNFSGVKHPLEVVDEARRAGWSVLLDAAAFVPTNRLDLSAVQPDYVSVSFYKMFGYPTGVGALLVHRRAFPKLRRPWFAGGTVNFATVKGQGHVLSPDEAGFEDGTLNYLSIPAIEIGLRHLESIGIETIGTRVACLTAWLLEELYGLRHSNGRPMVRIYGPTNIESRGGTVTLNLYDPDGRLLDYRRVEELAGEEGISLRTGCFCNPGAGETAEGLTEEDMRAGYELGAGANLGSFVRLMQSRGTNKSAGAIRASLGIVSNAADCERFLDFIGRFRDQARLAIGEVSFDIESCRVIRDGS